MEDTRFDALTKAFGALTTRRLTLGALLGGALGRLGRGEAAAKQRKKRRKKSNGCKTPCTPSAGGTGTCQAGRCVAGGDGGGGGIGCTGGLTDCSGSGDCTNLQTDTANCGT